MGAQGLEPMRLQKYLARAGVASRRASERLIEEGRVSVNGQAVCELGVKVVPGADAVVLDGAPVVLESEHVVLMLNKPAGCLTTMRDDRGRACVAELVPTDRYPGLFAVGRLDFDTTGLLLFTTDGELGHALLHPSHHVDKVYEAVVHGVPDDAALDRLRAGVVLDDGPTQPAGVRMLSARGRRARLEITIHEGRKRQVKRMCEAVGHPVERLSRVAFGPLSLDDLREGAWRTLSPDEVASLCRCAGVAC